MMKRMKSNHKSKETSITDLHESIIINILTFVPIQFVMRCSCVCKNWATLIAQTPFIECYDSSGRAPPQFLIEDRSEPSNLFLAQVDEHSCTTDSSSNDSLSKSRFSLKFLDNFYPNPSSYSVTVFTTCRVTGCIAVYVLNKYDHISPSRCHIFNPVTGQHILLECTGRDCRRWWHRCALVFAQKSNQLKLLAFFPRDFKEVGVKIQTIGTNLWRHIGRIPFNPKKQPFPTLANGLYYWIDKSKKLVYSFNAEEEVFEQIQTPPCIDDFSDSDLALLNGCLCIYTKSTIIQFWMMSDDGNRKSWTKKLVIDNHRICLDKILEPLKCLQNGEIVMLYRNYKAICCNPSTGSHKAIRFADKDSPENMYIPIPYVPSLKRVLPT